MNYFLFTLLLVFGSISSSMAQTGEIHFGAGVAERVSVSSVTWKEHFGARKEDPQKVYILMTQGAFRAPTSTNFEELMKSWIDEHPKAEMMTVFKIDGSKFNAVWVVDKDKNLNIYLVRRGGCPAGVMVLNQGDDTPLSRETYEVFEKEVWEAEKLARMEKLGIWSDAKKSTTL